MDRIHKHLRENPDHQLLIAIDGDKLLFSLRRLEKIETDDNGDTTLAVHILHEVRALTFQFCRLKMSIWIVQQQ